MRGVAGDVVEIPEPENLMHFVAGVVAERGRTLFRLPAGVVLRAACAHAVMVGEEVPVAGDFAYCPCCTRAISNAGGEEECPDCRVALTFFPHSVTS